MSGSTNALSSGSGILGILSSADVVNPLAAIKSAADTSYAVNQVQQQRAQQAAGQAFLDSIQNGQPNQSAFLSNMKANPTSAMAALAAANSGQTLDTNTYNLHNARINGAMASMAQLIADNPGGVPADKMHAVIDQELQQSNITPEMAQALHGQVTNNGMANTGLLLRGLNHGMEAKTALDTVKPAPVMQDVGGQIVTVQPSAQSASSPTSSLSVGSGGVTLGLSPAQLAQPYEYTDGKGVKHSTTVGEHLTTLGITIPSGGQQTGGGGPASVVPGRPPAPPRGTTVTTAPAPPAAPAAPAASGPQVGGAPPAPPGAPAGAGAGSGGIGSVLAPHSEIVTPGGPQIASTAPMAPTVGAAAPPSPAVAGDVSAMLAGMQRAGVNPLNGSAATAGPGAPTAPAPEAGWGSSFGSYGSTPAPAAVPAAKPAAQPPPAPASSGVAVSPTGGRSIAGPAPGSVEAKQETARASAKMGNDLVARGDQAPVNKANYANMLTDLERIGAMPAGGEKEVAINTFLQKATGYGFTMNPEQIAGANSFAKLANIAVGQQLAAIGGTDARQALFMGSNPNLDLSKLGNTQIIHMLQGNEDAIQAKSRAWQSWLNAGNGPDTYGKFQDDFNHHFDPRVFQSQYMGPDEVAALRKSMTPGEQRSFIDDVRYSREQGWIK